MNSEYAKLQNAPIEMRKIILKLAHNGGSNGAHIAPALSIVEIMTVLYQSVMKIDRNNPEWPQRDRFILSKGHGALAYYVTLYEVGIITKDQLFTFEENGGSFPGQPSKNTALGIDFSGGSLGLGLSYGAGIALGARQKKEDFNTYVLMGDGEINEGTVWESAMFASAYELNNLTVIIDKNGMQSDGCTKDILPIDVDSMWKGFGWDVITCDGHSIASLQKAFETPRSKKPLAIIATTIKGKGISFMENNKEWHHSRLTLEHFEAAIQELELRETD